MHKKLLFWRTQGPEDVISVYITFSNTNEYKVINGDISVF